MGPGPADHRRERQRPAQEGQAADHGALAGELGKLNEEYGEVQTRLNEVGRAMEALGSAGPGEDNVREALQKLDLLWDELFPAEKERIVRLLVAEVVVSQDGLLIRLRLNGLNSLVAELQGEGPAAAGSDGQTLDLRVPMELKRRSGRKEIVLPPDAEAKPKAQPQRPLVLALPRAHRWQRMIDSGEVPGMEAIAAQCGVNRTYVARMLQLASLAPALVRPILGGTEPSGISLAKLRKGVPESWDEQRRLLSPG